MVNIKDVSKLAGVSIATISRYLNNPEKLKPETNKKVENAIKILNFIPSAIAQGMRTQQSRYIAIVLEDMTNPFYTEVLYGAEQCARQNNYNIVVFNTIKDKQKKYLDILFERNFFGVVYCASIDEDNEKILIALKKRNIPLILIDNESLKNNYSCINTDNYKASYMGTKYLIDKGHKRIGLVCFNKFLDQIEVRKKGYIDALQDNFIEYDSSFIYKTDLSIKGGIKIASEILKEINRFTALFCLSDYIAIGMLKYFNNNKKNVPNDISILGFDDIEYSEIVEPGLTTIHQKRKKLGFLSVEKIISFLNKRPKNNLLIELSTYIVERESVKDISEL